mmetsp:Transcript_78337/g.123358  ORF Transcript_78337/g.123358 Transcript_78337/m.123358 type:complete len:213 (+) Transcript_78337:148-786(+)
MGILQQLARCMVRLTGKVLQIQRGVLRGSSTRQIIREFGFAPEVVDVCSQLSYSRPQRKWTFVDQFLSTRKLWTTTQWSTWCKAWWLFGRVLIWSFLGPQPLNFERCRYQGLLLHSTEIMLRTSTGFWWRLALLFRHVILQLLGGRAILFPPSATFSSGSQLHGFQQFLPLICPTTVDGGFRRWLPFEKSEGSEGAGPWLQVPDSSHDAMKR